MGEESKYFTLYNTGAMCIGTLMVILQLSFGYYHWQKPDRVAYHLKSMPRLKRWNKVAKTFAYLTLLMYTLLSLQLATTLMIGIAPNDVHCQIRTYWAVLTYHWSKGCVYGVLIARLRIAYVNTKFSYSRSRVIYPFYGLLFIYFVSAGILDVTQIDSHYESHEKWCDAHYPTWGLVGTLIFDSVIIIVCLVLLIKPLHTSVNEDNNIDQPKISSNSSFESETGSGSTRGSRSVFAHIGTITIANTSTTTIGNNSEKKKETQAKFKLVIGKYRKLAVVTLLSTLISMGFYTIASNDINNNVYIASFAGGVTLIDSVISVIFVFLFSSKHDDLYDKLCVCKKNLTKIKRSATLLSINGNVNNTINNNENVNGGKLPVGTRTPTMMNELDSQQSPYAAIDGNKENYGSPRQTLSSVEMVQVITTGVLNQSYSNNNSDNENGNDRQELNEGNTLELEVIETNDNGKSIEALNEMGPVANLGRLRTDPKSRNTITQTFAMSGMSATAQTEPRYTIYNIIIIVNPPCTRLMWISVVYPAGFVL